MATLTDITKKLKVYNPYALFVTPWADENTQGDATYMLDAVIRDTTTITQEDPTENNVENEFSSAPIVNTVTLGSYTFSAEVADMSPELLNVLCGYDVTETKAYAPSTYKPLYAEISLVFLAGKDKETSADKYIAATLPKVQLNSKATLDSLSSSIGRITLAGTGLNASVDGKQTPFVLDTDFTLPTRAE